MKLGDLFRRKRAAPLPDAPPAAGIPVPAPPVSPVATPPVVAPPAPAPPAMNEAERFLLELFLKPRQPSTITGPGWGELWAGRLGRPPQAVLDGMKRSGLLVRPDLAGLLECRHTVPELKELGRSLGLAMRGKKEDLVAALVASLQAGELERSLAGFDALVCSERGRALAAPAKERRAAERKEAEERSAAELRAGRYENACRTVAAQMARQPLGGAGMAHVPGSAARVREILVRLPGASTAEGDALVAAAMGFLWGDRPDRFLPKPDGAKGATEGAVKGTRRPRKTEEEKLAERRARDHAARASHAATLRGYRANRDVLTGVRILATPTSCDRCKAAEGTYAFENVPPLPHEECTHEKGCRCCYVPVTRF